VADEARFAYTVLARIVRPQGRHGEVLADLLTDFPEKFKERREIFLLAGETAATATEASARAAELEDFWLPQGKSAGRVVLKLAGCDSINDAEKLAGLLVAIPQEKRAQLDEDEFYIADLVGCEIVTAAGTIGTVESVDTISSGMPLLVVRAPDGAEILLPFVQRFLKKADIAGKRIEVEIPEGLLEINRPTEKTAAKKQEAE
jgi:16S rRNA processing protein RimM